MSEFSGWMDAAIKMWCMFAAALVVIGLLFAASYRFFGWYGPVGLVVFWFAAAATYEWRCDVQRRKWKR